VENNRGSLQKVASHSQKRGTWCRKPEAREEATGGPLALSEEDLEVVTSFSEGMLEKAREMG